MPNQTGSRAAWWTLLTTIGFVALWLQGCVGAGDPQASREESLGRGIVWGTLGTQGLAVIETTPIKAPVLSGQVVKVEGAAYVVREESGLERRVPHDENTRSDRPAHVGDRIEASLDVGGRASHIRNVDHLIP